MNSSPDCRLHHVSFRAITFVAALSCVLTLCGLALVPASADMIGGFNFPQGTSSFADSVIKYDPSYSGGNVPTAPAFTDPTAALGAPNYHNWKGAVSLGAGGLLELGFTDNYLSNSGTTSPDVFVFEVGPNREWTDVAVLPDAATATLLSGASYTAGADGYYSIGTAHGGRSALDIDAAFPGFAPGALVFNAVQLIDVKSQGGTRRSPTIGADIDAVGVIGGLGEPPITPEPASLLLLGVGGVMMFARRRRRLRQ